MVSHREQYESYLSDQKIETCGFHLKDEDDGIDSSARQQEEEELEREEMDMMRLKFERDEREARANQAMSVGTTFSSLANAQRKV